ncbi:hypothetical protein SM080_000727 [Cronobacter sakazakii]|nr:hypothetical protein [Cronobacter sakazakii]ELY4758260.1 hypothetical protein [Cronobacter sakazakii]MDK1098216.1 hypothetical protein [Cronobacter sakazakii]
MAELNFQKVSVVREKAGICEVCGRICKRKKEFYQTLNPFNRTRDGSLKTKADIRKEVTAKANEWSRLPVIHAKCESK